MNILIVGLGYAGGRFLHAFESLRHEGTCDIGTIGYVGRNTQNNGLPFFRSVAEGLAATKPDIVVLSVNDVYRMSILEEMSAFDGFVICEKPFLCPWDNTERAVSNLAKTSGFCLDLVERYSPITISLKEFVEANALCLMRANFT
jgi:predicted dehydrogenase